MQLMVLFVHVQGFALAAEEYLTNYQRSYWSQAAAFGWPYPCFHQDKKSERRRAGQFQNFFWRKASNA